jgi:hypothetical protein
MADKKKERYGKDTAGQATELDTDSGGSNEEKFSPLAIPLDKEPRLPDQEQLPPEVSASRRISQKEFLNKIYSRIDEKIVERYGKRDAFPSTAVIVLLLFLAPFIFLAGSDIYGLIKARLPSYMAPVEPKPAAPPPAVKKEDDLRAVLKQNQALIEKLARQNTTLSKKLTSLIKVQEKLAKKEPSKVVVLTSAGQATFSLNREKKVLYEISGLDIDDPVSADAVGKIKSTEILLAMVESFNRIMLNSDHPSVSDFQLNNTVKAKRLVIKRLRQLK